MPTKIASFWEDFIDILYPRVCASCHDLLVGTEYELCTRCLLTLPRLQTDGMIGSHVRDKFIGYQQVVSVQSFLEYQSGGKVQRLLHALKYRGDEALGGLMGRLCAEEWSSQGKIPQADVLVPVPLHPRKLRERGYNQSEAFARGFSEISGIQVDTGLLSREIYTLSQTGKSKAERIASMQGVFCVRTGVDVSALRIILMDDVLTTGATLEACIAVLIEAGCRELHIITIAAARY